MLFSIVIRVQIQPLLLMTVQYLLFLIIDISVHIQDSSCSQNQSRLVPTVAWIPDPATVTDSAAFPCLKKQDRINCRYILRSESTSSRLVVMQKNHNQMIRVHFQPSW